MLSGIEHLQQHDVMALMPQMFQTGRQRGDIVQQIAEKYDNATLAKRLRKLMKDGSGTRGAIGSHVFERLQDVLQVSGTVAGRYTLQDLSVERGECNRILLLKDKPGESRGQTLCILELRQARVRRSRPPEGVQRDSAGARGHHAPGFRGGLRHRG